MGKGDGHADNDFSLVSMAKCAKYHLRSECRATQDTPASTIFNFLKFPKPPRACSQQLVKFHRNRMNAVCSCRATPGTPASSFFFNFQNHREHVYSKFWNLHRSRMNGVRSCKATPGTPASTIFKFLNFQNHREHVYNNLWKFHRNRMNGVSSCRERATPGTPARTIFIYFF